MCAPCRQVKKDVGRSGQTPGKTAGRTAGATGPSVATLEMSVEAPDSETVGIDDAVGGFARSRMKPCAPGRFRPCMLSLYE